MTAPASLARVCAEYGFGLRLLAKGGIGLAPPVEGELPPDEILAWLRDNRQALIDWLAAGGAARCEACRADLWLSAATGPEVGGACGNDGGGELDPRGARHPSDARQVGTRPRCPWKRRECYHNGSR